MKSWLLQALLFSSIPIACNYNLSREEYLHWVTDYKNQLRVKTTFAGYVFDLQYQPYTFRKLQQEVRGLDVTKPLSQSNDIQYFILNVGTASGEDFLKYGTTDLIDKQMKEYYLSYRFQNDLTLEDSGEVLPCVLYHFERQSDKDGARNVVIGFDNKFKNSQEAKLVIRSDLFSTLPIKIKVIKAHNSTFGL